MNKTVKNFKFVLIIFLLSINLISSAPPFVEEQVLDSGLVIDYPPFGNLKQGVTQKFHFHVFNISNGVNINSSLICDFHLYKKDFASHLYKATTSVVHDVFDYEILVDGGNFTEVTEYAYIFQCINMDNSLGGYVVVAFKVTPSGNDIQTPEALLYLIIICSIFIFFLLSLFASIITPYKDKLNAKGEIVELMPAKYIKLFAISMTYLFFVLFLNSLVGLSENYITLAIFSGFIGFLFSLFMLLTYPFMIIIFVVAVFQVLIDLKNKKIIETLGVA